MTPPPRCIVTSTATTRQLALDHVAGHREPCGHTWGTKDGHRLLGHYCQRDDGHDGPHECCTCGAPG